MSGINSYVGGRIRRLKPGDWEDEWDTNKHLNYPQLFSSYSLSINSMDRDQN